MDEATKLHNRIVTEFMQKEIRSVYNAGGSYEDILVIMESIIFGIMLLGTKKEQRDPSKVFALMEAVFNAASERFIKNQ